MDARRRGDGTVVVRWTVVWAKKGGSSLGRSWLALDLAEVSMVDPVKSTEAVPAAESQ